MFFYITVILTTSVVVGAFLLKLAARHNRHTRPLSCYQCPVRMDGKTVLITGANSGIGKETAIGVVSLGAKVIMACRNLEKAEAAAEEIRQKTGVNPSLVSVVQLDVSDLDSVRNCSRKMSGGWGSSDKFPQISTIFLNILKDPSTAMVWTVSILPRISNSSNLLGIVPSAPVIMGMTLTLMFHSFFSSQIYASEPRLDVLINNAGVGIGQVETSKQGYEYTFAANYVGHFLFTHLLLGMLKKSSPSRIINVSSMRHTGITETLDFSREPKPGSDMKYPGLSGYDTSKLAQILHTNVLTKQLKEHSVVANSMHPGYVSSEIWHKDCYKKHVIKVMRFMGWLSTLIGRTSKDAAQTVIYMAADPALEKVSGQYFENMAISDQLSAFAKDPELAKKMWDVSMEMCKLTKKVE